MVSPNPSAVDILIAQTPIPDFMKKLKHKHIGPEDLVAGQYYLRFNGSLVRRIDAIKGDMIHCWDSGGAVSFKLENFLKLHPVLAPPGMVPKADSFDEEFTIQEEADALVASAFVMTSSGRFTQRLMIEVAEKLAHMMQLKCFDREQYNVEIRNSLKTYCRTWRQK